MWTLDNVDRLEQFSLSKIDSNYLDGNLKVFQKDVNRGFQLVRKVILEESDLSKIIQLMNWLVFIEKIWADGKICPLYRNQQCTRTLRMKLNLAHRVVNVAHRPNSKIYVNMPQTTWN